MTTTSILGSIGAESLAAILIAVVLGVGGGLLHFVAARDPADASQWWQSAVVGLVAGVGALWLSTPATVVAIVGQSLLTGFFGQAVLATLQARVTAGIARDRLQRTAAIAKDAIDLASTHPESPPCVVALRARLADITGSVP